MQTLQRISKREVRCPSNYVDNVDHIGIESIDTEEAAHYSLEGEFSIMVTLKVVAACMSCNGMSEILQYLQNLLVH